MSQERSPYMVDSDGKNMQHVRFRSETKLRINFQEGDTMLWTRGQGVFASVSDTPDILDVWRLTAADSALMTSRIADVPDWFPLHPSEKMSADSLMAIALMVAGEGAEGVMEGPHIWRVMAGDRLAWTGPPRPNGGDGKDWFRFFTFEENALAVGSPTVEMYGIPMFGMPTTSGFTPEQNRRGTGAMAAIKSFGVPNVISADPMWRLYR